MAIRDKKRIHSLYLFIDILLINFSFILSHLLRVNQYPISSIQSGFKLYALIFILWEVTLIFILNNYHLYSTDRSLTMPQETFLVFKAVFYSTLLLSIIIFGLKIFFFSRMIFFVSGLFLFINLSFWRVVKRLFIRHLIFKGRYNFNILIVGAGKSGKELSEEIMNNPYLGLRVVGFLDDYKTAKVNGYDVIGKIQDIERIIQRKFVDEVYITIPSERTVVSDILSKVRKLGKTARILADNFEIPMYKIKMNYIGYIPLISYYERTIHGSECLVKRTIDLIGAMVILIMLLPLVLILTFLIKVDSRGQTFYLSKRSGKKGNVFTFYKFRSMCKDADDQKERLRCKSEVKGPIFKIRDDPRMTRLGRFLRRYSLDELPQLINVLRGEMSLVGPRPFPVEESEQFKEWQMRRLEVKPGLTCLAQVRGRSNLSFYKWMKWDLWYIDNWSLGLDFRILFWTIPSVIKGKGAY